MQPTTAGLIHTALAGLCIILGLAQLMQRKGGAMRRVLGYVFVCAMVMADLSALAVPQSGFSLLHLRAIVNLVCIAAATLPMLRRPRETDWMSVRYRWMAGAYLGLVAAAATELVVRIVPFTARAQVWTATAVVTGLTAAVGCFLIGRYDPPTPPHASGGTNRTA
jgi:uncharacterized membrane protein